MTQAFQWIFKELIFISKNFLGYTRIHMASLFFECPHFLARIFVYHLAVQQKLWVFMPFVDFYANCRSRIQIRIKISAKIRPTALKPYQKHLAAVAAGQPIETSPNQTKPHPNPGPNQYG